MNGWKYYTLLDRDGIYLYRNADIDELSVMFSHFKYAWFWTNIGIF